MHGHVDWYQSNLVYSFLLLMARQTYINVTMLDCMGKKPQRQCTCMQFSEKKIWLHLLSCHWVHPCPQIPQRNWQGNKLLNQHNVEEPTWFPTLWPAQTTAVKRCQSLAATGKLRSRSLPIWVGEEQLIMVVRATYKPFTHWWGSSHNNSSQ